MGGLPTPLGPMAGLEEAPPGAPQLPWPLLPSPEPNKSCRAIANLTQSWQHCVQAVMVRPGRSTWKPAGNAPVKPHKGNWHWGILPGPVNTAGTLGQRGTDSLGDKHQNQPQDWSVWLLKLNLITKMCYRAGVVTEEGPTVLPLRS